MCHTSASLRAARTDAKEGANKSHVYSASAYGLGCKAWFAANGPSPLQEFPKGLEISPNVTANIGE
ncbi:hypothetical protein TUM17383_10590 [Shewanella algae]|nr:hypothetical protein TUM17383_10590 [Shewanella algae]